MKAIVIEGRLLKEITDIESIAIEDDGKSMVFSFKKGALGKQGFYYTNASDVYLFEIKNVKHIINDDAKIGA